MIENPVKLRSKKLSRITAFQLLTIGAGFAEDGVDESGDIFVGFSFDDFDPAVDDGIVRRFHKENLGQAEQHGKFGKGSFFGKFFSGVLSECLLQKNQPAQRREHQHVGKSSVFAGERIDRAFNLAEKGFFGQDFLKHFGGGLAGIWHLSFLVEGNFCLSYAKDTLITSEKMAQVTCLLVKSIILLVQCVI